MDTFEEAAEGAFQIIFMDIQMPVMNGYEAADTIRHSQKKQGKDIPIIAVSANAFQSDIDRSLQAGMNEHLSKPVNRKILYKTIMEQISKI